MSRAAQIIVPVPVIDMRTEIMNGVSGNWAYPFRFSKQMSVAVGVVVSTSHPMPCVCGLSMLE